MPISPEQKPEQMGVQKRPTEIEIPEYIEKGGVTPVPTQFTAKVTDDSGKPLIQSSDDTTTQTVQLPKTQDELKELSKGSITDSITWFAAFWLRIFKKAVHFGWKIIGK